LYILDTDHWTVLQNGEGVDYDRLLDKLQAHRDASFFVTIVTFQEVMSGWLKFLNNAKLSQGVVRAYERLEFLLDQFSSAAVLPFDNAAASVFDDFRAARIRVATMDLRIGSIAIANQMSVLTRNTVDFERIPGLTIDDWLR
jgi:tRNA(fMet)-specific endonuclease VapC